MTRGQKAAVAAVLVALAVAAVIGFSESELPHGTAASRAGETEQDLARYERERAGGAGPTAPALGDAGSARPARPGETPAPNVGAVRSGAPSGTGALDRQLVPIADRPTPAVGLHPGPPPDLPPRERLAQALLRRAALHARRDQLLTALADAEREGDQRAITARRALLDNTLRRLEATETEVRDLGGPPIE